MAGDVQPIVIKKKKGGGGHGHHGGAWKVAYADFVTAMMAFFMVMWLMGTDEETKAAISHYFNHPNTPYSQGGTPDSKEMHPMGEREGSGDSVMNGLDGFYPEDLIERPVRSVQEQLREYKMLASMIEEKLHGEVEQVSANAESLSFSLPEQVMFAAGSADLLPEAKTHLAVLADLFKQYEGFVMIEGHTDVTPVALGGKYADNWQLSLARAQAVMKAMKSLGVAESKMIPIGRGHSRPISSNRDVEGRKKNRRVEFTLTYEHNVH